MTETVHSFLDLMTALGCTTRNVKGNRGGGGWVRRTFGNVSYYFSSQPERALNPVQCFFQNVYDRFNLVYSDRFNRLVGCYRSTGIKNSICEYKF